MNVNYFKNQIIPLALTVVTASGLTGVLYLVILGLNYFTITDIVLEIRLVDVVIGMTIYLKTSIDFAIFIARLMDKYPGLKGRIGVEIGTALGNAMGTILILIIWTFFKEIRWLLALMVFVAALVLFRLAEDGLEHAHDFDGKYPKWFQKLVDWFGFILAKINFLIAPLLKYVLPDLKVKTPERVNFWQLLGFAFTVPFILGLDDFAGYVPLFSIVNVFGFSIGVFAGHMILNALLYISPERTIKAVKNPIISFLGSIAFVALAVWGLVEVVKIIGH
jgi:hypothetical protein